ncbi:hypothetical protein [Stenotrophomonas sp. PS02289]|uniref:hypothetical protein n=1 Tax=Stenotrophomonas sp. PS02289 TaxID=2991422 RepID=UPI00249C390A|nr:hypothetical protein [Stenotrophomonas sp. PS02289]
MTISSLTGSRPHAALLALSLCFAFASTSQAAPAACMDARELKEMKQITPNSIALLASDQTTWQVNFQNECPGLMAAGKPKILAKDGQVCGTGNEFVRAGGRDCAIATVQQISRRDFADIARQADRSPLTTLPTVNVSEAKRTLRGSPSYCFDTRHVRSYGDNAKGFIVQTNPRRSGGNREYVVEVANNCRALMHSPAIQFKSGYGTSLICGNPGDVIIVQEQPQASERAAVLRDTLVTAGERCDVLSVYPAG